MLEALVRLPPPGEARFAGLATLLLASRQRMPAPVRAPGVLDPAQAVADAAAAAAGGRVRLCAAAPRPGRGREAGRAPARARARAPAAGASQVVRARVPAAVPAASRASERPWSWRGRVHDSDDGASHGRGHQVLDSDSVLKGNGGCDWQLAAPASPHARPLQQSPTGGDGGLRN